MELTHHYPLRPVHDKRASLGHERQFTDIDLLLTDVEHFLLRSLIFLVKDHKPDPDFERNSIGHSLLETLAHLVFRGPQRITGELQHCRVVVVGDRKDAGQRCLEPLVLPPVRIALHLQKLLVRPLLDFNQVRDIDAGKDSREIFPLDQPVTSRFRHVHAPLGWKKVIRHWAFIVRPDRND